MKKILAVLLAAVMSAALLTSCTKQNTTTDIKKQDSDENIEICFDDYTKNFGKDFEAVAEYYSDIGELEGGDGWLGSNWYSLPNGEYFGFREILVAADVPVQNIYPGLADKGVISKTEFEEYIGIETELVPLFDGSEFGREYLYYEYENLKVLVFCDSEGNVDCAEEFCMFVEQ